ncbi:hypothetical protein QJS10_CPA03g00765 [Acorus calamus]|uniref:ATP phosphoribosyltransferase n=1 Tax=Acorus calamus TaxID=4465 RepID=A0AAV9F7U1_ACOCL|nr:hypothetical protein QJS10_CPA03g00765 [Acorus calamus]
MSSSVCSLRATLTPLSSHSPPLHSHSSLYSSSPPPPRRRSSHRIYCAAASIDERSVIRLGIPSKGRMADETLALLKNCQLTVKQVNPRQYVAYIPQLPGLEVWLQRPKDIVRKLVSGDLDLGIVGLDTVCEYGQIPKYGIFENINSMSDLAKMPEWTSERPLRIATGFVYLGNKYAKENGLNHVTFSTGEGAFEALPAMGSADAILDLVSSGTTLRENNLKEIDGGVVLESQAVFVGSKNSLIRREGVLDITHEMLERLEAHLRAIGQVMVTANMRGNSAQEVAERVLNQTSLAGLQGQNVLNSLAMGQMSWMESNDLEKPARLLGPTISPVYCRGSDGTIRVEYYAISICVAKKDLYKSIRQLRAIDGSGVLNYNLTYIFEEETTRWLDLLERLGL